MNQLCITDVFLSRLEGLLLDNYRPTWYPRRCLRPVKEFITKVLIARPGVATLASDPGSTWKSTLKSTWKSTRAWLRPGWERGTACASAVCRSRRTRVPVWSSSSLCLWLPTNKNTLLSRRSRLVGMIKTRQSFVFVHQHCDDSCMRQGLLTSATGGL